jgi:predicted transglutaminase-like cysteine proteinase
MNLNWLQELKDVNNKINSYPYVTDSDNYNLPDYWTNITEKTSGDCDDYAIGKLEELVKLRWNIELLHLATCYVETGGAHCVLIVEGVDSVYMLDNRQDDVVLIQNVKALGYKGISIQDVGGFNVWVEWKV